MKFTYTKSLLDDSIISMSLELDGISISISGKLKLNWVSDHHFHKNNFSTPPRSFVFFSHVSPLPSPHLPSPS